jgi:hypothetical protein
MRAWLLPIILAASTATPELGTELRRHGYAFRPPAGFSLMPMERFRGTQVGVVRGEEGDGLFSAALIDGAGEDAATIWVAEVPGTLEVSPAARDDFSAAVMRHLNQELGLSVAMERSSTTSGPAPRIELVGTLRREGQLRRILVAGIAGSGRHLVITASAPADRLDAMMPALSASLDTVVMERRPGMDRSSREVLGVGAMGLLGALLASMVIRRRVLRARKGA